MTETPDPASGPCTGPGALTCPTHGTCTCPITNAGGLPYDDMACPMHSPTGPHAPDADINMFMTAVGEQLLKQQRQSAAYAELAQLGTVSEVLNRGYGLMRHVAWDVTQVLQDIHGVDIDDRVYQLVKALVPLRDTLTAQFAAEQYAGSVDRSRAVVTHMLTDTEADATLNITRGSACDGSLQFCPEHGWGAHQILCPITLRCVDDTHAAAVYAAARARKAPARQVGTSVVVPGDDPEFLLSAVENAVTDGHMDVAAGSRAITEMEAVR